MRDDIHRITLELKERSMKVDKLANRFQVLVSKAQGPQEDGEPKSQAYYIIKAAQEREELQQQGDELDSKVQKAEKEVAGLEAALSAMLGVNTKYNASLRNVEDKAVAAQQQELQKHLDQLYDKVKAKRAEEKELMDQVQMLEQQVKSRRAEQAGLQELVKELQRKQTDAEKQLEEQADKHQRAAKNLERLQRQLRTKLGLPAAGPPSNQEDDIALADIKESTSAMLQELSGLCSRYPELNIAHNVAAMGLKLPSGVASSAGNSRAGSLAGSRSPSQAGSVRLGPSMKSLDGQSIASQSTAPGRLRSPGGIAAVKSIQLNL